MATIDLTNDITPLHKFRPVKPTLAAVRAKIKTAVGSNPTYTDEYLGNCNRNDLYAICREHAIALP